MCVRTDELLGLLGGLTQLSVSSLSECVHLPPWLCSPFQAGFLFASCLVATRKRRFVRKPRRLRIFSINTRAELSMQGSPGFMDSLFSRPALPSGMDIVSRLQATTEDRWQDEYIRGTKP